MNKKPQHNKKAVRAPKALKTPEDERTRIHRAINWIVSVILLVFAIWSIKLNTDTKILYSQAQQAVNETDNKITALTKDLKDIKDVCSQMTTVDIPTETIDTNK